MVVKDSDGEDKEDDFETETTNSPPLVKVVCVTVVELSLYDI